MSVNVVGVTTLPYNLVHYIKLADNQMLTACHVLLLLLGNASPAGFTHRSNTYCVMQLICKAKKIHSKQNAAM